MRKIIVAVFTALTLAFTMSPAIASDGLVGPTEYASAQQGWTKTHVENVWDNNGVRVDAWLAGDHSYIQKKYPTTDDSSHALATYVYDGSGWDLTQKYWCTPTKCTPGL